MAAEGPVGGDGIVNEIDTRNELAQVGFQIGTR